MTTHTIKFEYEDGEKLDVPTSWCGASLRVRQFCFIDAQHLALSVEGSIAPCKNCIKAIIRTLKKELDDN